MKLDAAVIATLATLAACLAGVATAAPPEQCQVPQSLLDTDADFSRVLKVFKTEHRIAITVIGSGSSGLAGPDG
ncbi:MAG: SGNH/GDSL hydrolase family protein, partial [Xanthobacteraceae bacterium]